MLKSMAEIGNDPYQNLAGAIILAAYADLFNKENKQDAYQFFFASEFYLYADIVGLSPVKVARIQDYARMVYTGLVKRKREVVSMGEIKNKWSY